MSSTLPKDPYDALGVARDADDSQIKKAYRKLALKFHPDTNPDDPQAELKFREATEAYEILSDSERRATYDRYGHDGLRSSGFSGGDMGGFGSLSDILGAVFGNAFGGAGQQAGPARGDDVATRLKVTLEDCFKGTTKEVNYDVVARCGTCDGTRAKPGSKITSCATCGGHGIVQRVMRTPFGEMAQRTSCPDCQGQGQVPEVKCTDCVGTGFKTAGRTVSIDVPAGVSDGQRIRLSGRGGDGDQGAPAGDLYVLIEVKADKVFTREGNDLVASIPISAPLASLGTNQSLDLFGEEAQIEIVAGTQPGGIVTLKGRGMPRISGGRRGDLHAVIDVVVPRNLDDQQKKLMQQLEDSLRDSQLNSDESLGDKFKRFWRRG